MLWFARTVQVMTLWKPHLSDIFNLMLCRFIRHRFACRTAGWCSDVPWGGNILRPTITQAEIFKDFEVGSDAILMMWKTIVWGGFQSVTKISSRFCAVWGGHEGSCGLTVLTSSQASNSSSQRNEKARSPLSKQKQHHRPEHCTESPWRNIVSMKNAKNRR